MKEQKEILINEVHQLNIQILIKIFFIIMTEQQIKNHEDWYEYYFGYRHLTPERECKRGALTTKSKW